MDLCNTTTCSILQSSDSDIGIWCHDTHSVQVSGPEKDQNIEFYLFSNNTMSKSVLIFIFYF